MKCVDVEGLGFMVRAFRIWVSLLFVSPWEHEEIMVR